MARLASRLSLIIPVTAGTQWRVPHATLLEDGSPIAQRITSSAYKLPGPLLVEDNG